MRVILNPGTKLIFSVSFQFLQLIAIPAAAHYMVLISGNQHVLLVDYILRFGLKSTSVR